MITRGITNGAVLQRRGNESDFILSADKAPALVYSGVSEGTAEAAEVGPGRYRITGIPCGGPYTLRAGEQVFHDVYIGDVWMLAGQSNMQGVGWYAPEDLVFAGENDVRALYMDNQWRRAKHPLHREFTAYDKVHTEVLHALPPSTSFNGVGPGLAFAQQMKRITGVPQGLICSAHGGTSLDQWSPAGKALGPDKSLYAAMLRRFADNGSHIRGIFWFQGCADAFENRGFDFRERTEALILACRDDMGYEGEALPFVQVQLGRVVHVKLPGLEENWTQIREAQRLISYEIPDTVTLSSVTCELDDLIHISGRSHRVLGRYAADVMASLCGYRPCTPPPVLSHCEMLRHPISGWATVDVTFDNLIGGLTSEGRPSGFCLAEKGKAPDTDFVYAVSLEGDTARLRIHREIPEVAGMALYYGYGLNPYANLTDRAGRAVPCFGPVAVPIKEE